MLTTKTFTANILKLRQERNLVLAALEDKTIHGYDYEDCKDVGASGGYDLGCGDAELFSWNSIDFVSSQQAELVFGDSNGDLHIVQHAAGTPFF